ncbi:MAG: hypothetical protein OQL08_04345 [Gammaproteobacteria bacterium]|nr:hypothetical protein [Gammaproteobacteria bacterium]
MGGEPRSGDQGDDIAVAVTIISRQVFCGKTLSEHDFQVSIHAAVKRILNLSKRAFVLLAIAYVGYFALTSRELLFGLFTTANPMFVFLSLLCWVLAHFIIPAFTVRAMSGFSTSLSYREAFHIHASRLPAKYLPGGIWHTVARAADYKSKNISTTGIGYYLLLEHLVAAAVTLFVGGGIVLTVGTVSGNWLGLIQVIVAAAGIALFLLPQALVLIRPYRVHAISLGGYIQGVALVMVFWLAAAAAFVFFIKAFDVLTADYSMIDMGGIYIFSWGIGFVAIFAPQGIGVTEFVSGSLLRPDIPLGSFMVLLASFRINVFLADMATWMISLKWRA